MVLKVRARVNFLKTMFMHQYPPVYLELVSLELKVMYTGFPQHLENLEK